MSYIEINIPTADGSSYPIHENEDSCKDAIHTFFTDDFAAPSKSDGIFCLHQNRRNVELIIPYDEHSEAIVRIDGNLVE